MTNDEVRRRAGREWTRVVGPYYSRATLLRDLALTPTQLDELINHREILRLERGDLEFFPAFQFAHDGTLLPDLKQVLLALNPDHDPDIDWSVTRWLCERRPEFDGANAVELLWERRLLDVLRGGHRPDDSAPELDLGSIASTSSRRTRRRDTRQPGNGGKFATRSRSQPEIDLS
ncbi:hypothetical protein ROT00_07495 [Agromyces mediolanus]|uniref:hypothetical protein n=1 Tax=Agromyces mediolanus TaxID=41986 RepID=UPI003833CBD4